MKENVSRLHFMKTLASPTSSQLEKFNNSG
jgi:hypothetical protein